MCKCEFDKYSAKDPIVGKFVTDGRQFRRCKGRQEWRMYTTMIEKSGRNMI